MATYSMKQLKALAGTTGTAEQGARNIPEHSFNGHVGERSTLPDFRVDIRREIYEAVIRAGGAVTRAQIAKAVNRKKSTWLIDRIEACVADGLLTRSQSYWKNGMVMYYYEAVQ